MSDQIKQIAERLQGLRDVLELTPQEVAESCQLTVEEYLGMESGEKDISVSALWKAPRGMGNGRVRMVLLVAKVRPSFSTGDGSP